MRRSRQPDGRTAVDQDALVGGARVERLLDERLVDLGPEDGQQRADARDGRRRQGGRRWPHERSSPPGGGGPKVTAAGGPSAVGTGGGMPSRCALLGQPGGRAAERGREGRRRGGRRPAPRRRQRGGGPPALGGQRGWAGTDEPASMATPPMPSRSATARRARGLATRTTATTRTAAAASASARRRAGRCDEGTRRLQPGDHPIGQLDLAGEVQRVGQRDEGAFQVDGHRTAPPSSARSRSSARDRRDFTRPGWDLQRGRGLGLRQAGEVAERDDRAIPLVQPAECGTQLARGDLAQGEVLGRSRRGSADRGRPHGEALPPAPAAAPVAGLVGDDLHQPGPQRAAVLEPAQRAERLHERLLGDILGLALRSADGEGGAQRRPLVAGDEHAEGFAVTSAGARDEGGVLVVSLLVLHRPGLCYTARAATVPPNPAP